MPINFIHNQIQTKAAMVREKIPLPVKLLAGAAGLVLIALASLLIYRAAPDNLPFLQKDSERGAALDPHDPLMLLPDVIQQAQQINSSCELEMALCSDGSYVGRVGENCEFALCPDELAPPPANAVYDSFVNPTNQQPNESQLPEMTEEEYAEYQYRMHIESLAQ